MLTELRIRGLGVIDEATLEPHPGLTVVTGETGAGKTMVVTGLGLIAGARADAKLVRIGADRMSIEATFDAVSPDLAARVEEAGGELDGAELLVSRQVADSGRSRSFLGGVQVPAGVVTDLVGELVTIHGQSEQIRLGTPDRQRAVLDRAAGGELAAVLARYSAAFARRRQAQAELADLTEHQLERAREIDLLTFGLDEIGAVNPQAGEDVALAAEAKRLQASDDLRLAVSRAATALAGDDDPDTPAAVSLLATAKKALESAAAMDELVTGLAEQARDIAYALTDLAAQASSYLADLDADPARLEWIAERRADLQRLTRKYGATVDEVLQWAADAVDRLTTLENGDERVAELNAQIADLTAALEADAALMTALRLDAAQRLSAAVRTELAALALPHARLEFAVTRGADLGPYGADQVALLFAANPGSEPGPLARMASGGELSRVRLALEVVLAGDADGQTFVFDEVDAGVGGAVALEIGARLARLAERCQVIVVTHLAQVAAFGHRHVVVAKSDDGQVTTSGLVEVTGERRRVELARMMGGLEGTDASLAHAAELLAQAGRA